MKKIISIVLVIAMLMSVSVMATGCRQSTKVEHNVSKEADNFNVVRRVVVMSTVTDKILFECVGRIAIFDESTESGGQLEIIAETARNQYKKHMIGLNSATTTYIVEDLYGAPVNKYRYTINYQPESIIPITIEDMNKGE